MRLFFNRLRTISAADVAGGAFIAQRDLSKSLRSHVLSGSELTESTAEILAELFLAGSKVTSSNHAQPDGFIHFRELRDVIGYSAGMFSRRLAELAQRGWVETQMAATGSAGHGNSQQVRITPKGAQVFRPVWERFNDLAENLLKGVSASDLAAHYRVNELMSDRLRGPRFWLNQLQSSPAQRPARRIRSGKVSPIVLPAREPGNSVRSVAGSLSENAEFLD